MDLSPSRDPPISYVSPQWEAPLAELQDHEVRSTAVAGAAGQAPARTQRCHDMAISSGSCPAASSTMRSSSSSSFSPITPHRETSSRNLAIRPCIIESPDLQGRHSPPAQEGPAREKWFHPTAVHGMMSPDRSSSSDSSSELARFDFVVKFVQDVQEKTSYHYEKVHDVYGKFIVHPALDVMARGARFPLVCISLVFVTSLIFMIAGLASFPMNVVMDFDAFLQTDVKSSIQREAFWAAERAKPKLSTRRLQAKTVYSMKDFYIAYRIKDTQRVTTLLRERTLSDMSTFETNLRSSSAWQHLCQAGGEDNLQFCDPGITMPGYVLPTMTLDAKGAKPERLTMDGHGWDPLPLETSLWLLEEHDFTSLLLPTGYPGKKETNPWPPHDEVEVLRSAFRFKLPVGSTEDSSAHRSASKTKWDDEWNTFVKDTLLPVLDKDPPSELFDVYFDGTGFKELEIQEALRSDMLLTIGSIVVVLSYLIFHLRSILLTVVGLMICLSAVPLAYVVCAILTGTNTVNFTAFLAIFLAVGFGCDVIFVYSDFWTESAKHYDDFENRLQWTYGRAGRASFVTTATTSLSFFANLASVIRALRQFGFFMGLCVMLAWALISLLFVPLCVLDERIQVFRLCKDKATPGSGRRHWLGVWCDLISRWRRTFLVVPVFMLLVGLIMAGAMVKPLDGIPSLFPEDHNRVEVKEVMKQFEDYDKTAFKNNGLELPSKVTVCSEGSFDGNRCAIYWCEVTHAPLPKSNAAGKDSRCQCYRNTPETTCVNSTSAYMNLRMVSTTKLAERFQFNGADDQKTLTAHLSKAPSLGLDWKTASYSVSKMPALVQHEWESGKFQQWSMTDIKTRVERTETKAASCGWNEVCFCGAIRACSLDASKFSFAGDLQLQESTFRRLSEKQLQGDSDELPQPSPPHPPFRPRSLQSMSDLPFKPIVPSAKRVKVRVGFGLEINTDMQMLGERSEADMWKYSDDFQASMPWTQRNLRDFCEGLTTNADLRVTWQWCWFKNFRDHLAGSGQRFPVQSFLFDELAMKFIKSQMSDTPGHKYLWVVDGVIKAVYTSNLVDLNVNADADKIRDVRSKWDTYVDDWNQAAVVSAKGAFHVSKTWVELDASAELISSAIITLVILLILAFSFMVLFTRSVALSLFVVGATVAAICALTFFIIVIMQWEVGLIEVIAIVYFIGYAVTYSLHIAHKYACDEALHYAEDGDDLPSSPPGGPLGAGVGPLHRVGSAEEARELRYRRTRFSIVSMGSATLGSAATTAGASLFLCFATLTIFQRLGGMCLTVTLVSIVIALAPLPAALMLIGPLRPGKGFLYASICPCRACFCPGTKDKSSSPTSKHHFGMQEVSHRDAPRRE